MVLMAVKSSWLATKDILHVSVRGRKEVQVLGQRREKRVTDTARAARKKGRARQAKSATTPQQNYRPSRTWFLGMGGGRGRPAFSQSQLGDGPPGPDPRRAGGLIHPIGQRASSLKGASFLFEALSI